MNIHLDPTKKHDAVWIFDVKNGNPNGDPDSGNQPRQLAISGHGLVTDACLKRKVRNHIDTYYSHEEGYKTFVKDDTILNAKIENAFTQTGTTFKNDKEKSSTKEQRDSAREQLQADYFDVRMFGGVMSTGRDAGQVRGPIQVSFAQSAHPIEIQEFALTRKAITNEKDENKVGTFGRKFITPYGLYVAHIHYNPNDGMNANVSEQDLERFFEAVMLGFESDRSAARGEMTTRGLYVYSHEKRMGNAPAQNLFDLVKIDSDTDCPLKFSDYTITVDNNVPSGVSVAKLVG
jgi:CRISPR-associated protein Csd2